MKEMVKDIRNWIYLSLKQIRTDRLPIICDRDWNLSIQLVNTKPKPLIKFKVTKFLKDKESYIYFKSNGESDVYQLQTGTLSEDTVIREDILEAIQVIHELFADELLLLEYNRKILTSIPPKLYYAAFRSKLGSIKLKGLSPDCSIVGKEDLYLVSASQKAVQLCKETNTVSNYEFKHGIVVLTVETSLLDNKLLDIKRDTTLLKPEEHIYTYRGTIKPDNFIVIKSAFEVEPGNLEDGITTVETLENTEIEVGKLTELHRIPTF